MHCTRIKLPNGAFAIVCSSRKPKHRSHRCEFCSGEAGFQCDARLAGSEGKTCDRWLCADHAHQVAPDKHLCPPHEGAYLMWRLRHPEKAKT